MAIPVSAARMMYVLVDRLTGRRRYPAPLAAWAFTIGG
jgi:hypothetical protein